MKKDIPIIPLYHKYCHVRNYIALHHDRVDLEKDVQAYTATVHGDVKKLEKLVRDRLAGIGLKNFSEVEFATPEGPKDSWPTQPGTYAQSNMRFYELLQEELRKQQAAKPLPKENS